MTDTQNSRSFDEIWEGLKEGIDKIMVESQKTDYGNYKIPGIDYDTYIKMYSEIHNHCAATSQNDTSSRNDLAGKDLYDALTRYLECHLSTIKEHSKEHVEEMLLKYYSHQWDVYTRGSRVISRIFNYLNRFWIKRQHEEEKNGAVYHLRVHPLLSWRKYFFEFVQKDVVSALLVMIKKARDGEQVECSDLTKVISALVALGVDDSEHRDEKRYDDEPPYKRTLEVYQEYFEKPFVAATEIYYKTESEDYISKNSISDYMIKAEKRLQEESDRVANHLDDSTHKVLIGTCEKVLVKDHAEALCAEFQNLLNKDKRDDLQRMYSLLARVPEGLNPLRERFEKHVQKAGEDAIIKIASSGESVDPKTYVDSLLEVHKKYDDLVVTAFSGDSGFVASLDKACKVFVNNNKVSKPSSSTSKSPELLARFCDSLLKKNAKNPEEGNVEIVLENVMTVFKYLEDRDVFLKFYSKMLAKRLVNNTYTSDDIEGSMINKLKEVCGFEYTSKLQRMLTDMSLSKELNEKFKGHKGDRPEEAASFEMQVLVLGTGSWPLSSPPMLFQPPLDVLKMIERFEAFYQHEHSGRKLNWLYQLSKAELKTHYLPKTAYTFQVSTYQMGVLLQFNDATKYTYENLKSSVVGEGKTNLEPLNSALAVLVMAKVLHISNGKVGDESAEFELNFEFKSKKIKVNLNKQLPSEQKAETNETNKAIENDRKYEMQAAIVRIMKARKSMKHVALIDEVITQLQARFKPLVPDIKKSVDVLLEKEFIRRHEGQMDMYDYVA